MCGRFTLTASTALIKDRFQISEMPEMEPRYNIAPSQPIATVMTPRPNHRQFQWMRWGLIPSWSKDIKIGNRLINARAETLTEKPAFRSAIKQKRCLILADGFYEWQPQGKKKQPYYFQQIDRQPFAFAGLWDSWHSAEGDSILSCTIITTSANERVQPVHDRMPVILSDRHWDEWLDPDLKDPQKVLHFLQPYQAEEMTANPVSLAVNNPAHKGQECVQTI